MAQTTPTVPFPHDVKSAGKTNQSGILTVNDIITQDVYGIMTRATASDAAEQTFATYAYNAQDQTASEITRVVHSQSTGGSDAAVLTSVRNANGTMQQTIASTAQSTSLSCANNSATFDATGLFWSSADSSLYLGQKQFRIKFEGAAAPDTTPSLTIQFLDPTSSSYITLFAVGT